MSQFRESLHFRRHPTMSEVALRAALRSSSLSGVLFAERQGWRTFVPFESMALHADAERTVGAQLSRAVDAPVLQFHYAEDHFWAFLVWEHGAQTSLYTCEFLKNSCRVDTSALDMERLSALLPPRTSMDSVVGIVRPAKRSRRAGRDSAMRFLELLGIDMDPMLRPETVSDQVEALREDRDHFVLGSPTADSLGARVVTPRASSWSIQPAREEWTAREALALVRPYAVSQWSDAVLTGALSMPIDGSMARHPEAMWISATGRSTPDGGWSFYFRSPSRDRRMVVSLVTASRRVIVTFDAHPWEFFLQPIDERWIDSPFALAVAEPAFTVLRTSDTPPLSWRIMQLFTQNGCVRWLVRFGCRSSGLPESYSVHLDAESGSVLSAEQRDLSQIARNR